MFKAVAVYTIGRIAIFAILLALLWAAELGSFPGILFALLLSMPAAYFLLGKQREDLAAAVIERREARVKLRERLRGASETASDAESDREQETQQ
ncbi:MAG: DUF4229 domain-containing protein [Geodermatophilaceae bacterium]|jgi:hypothetical protein|nr:DUF4229 domain-containing protein [Geodermatophilaceae bacterium]MDQ3475280.1 DUF4229 domain-containing protein [Actinomycetota bacterium]